MHCAMKVELSMWRGRSSAATSLAPKKCEKFSCFRRNNEVLYLLLRPPERPQALGRFYRIRAPVSLPARFRPIRGGRCCAISATHARHATAAVDLSARGALCVEPDCSAWDLWRATDQQRRTGCVAEGTCGDHLVRNSREICANTLHI